MNFSRQNREKPVFGGSFYEKYPVFVTFRKNMHLTDKIILKAGRPGVKSNQEVTLARWLFPVYTGRKERRG